MPPKRTPVKGTKDTTPKTTKVKTPRVIVPEVVARPRDSSTGSTTSTHSVVTPPMAGISPDFMAFIQMQERMRMEERAIMERQRKEDLERADLKRHHQQKAHEAQMQLLQAQIAAMSSSSSKSNSKSTSKLPMFDMVKDKDTFKLWKSRWDSHVQGHQLDKISDPAEQKIRLKSELTSCLSDSTLSWLLNNNFPESDLLCSTFILQAIELKINESSNPLIQQIEMSKILQSEHETGDHLGQRIREIANKCSFDTITNYQDHYSMVTLLRAVKPQYRKKMLLEKVDTFDKAMAVLLSEEQANLDSKQCTSTSADGATFATSAYKRNQTHERQSFASSKNVSEKAVPRSDYTCRRCEKPGHFIHDCPSINMNCQTCGNKGHTAKTCDKHKNPPGSGFANTIRAHAETLSPNDLALFNASQIEKAEHCGLTYNVVANDIENPENMTRHQRFGMFGHLIK